MIFFRFIHFLDYHNTGSIVKGYWILLYLLSIVYVRHGLLHIDSSLLATLSLGNGCKIKYFLICCPD